MQIKNFLFAASLSILALSATGASAEKKEQKSPDHSVDVSKGKPDSGPAAQTAEQGKKDDKALADAKKDGSYYRK